MKFLSARRRNPIVALFLLVAALGLTGVSYSVVTTAKPAEAAMGSQTQVEEGKKMLRESGLAIISAENLTDAAQKVVGSIA